MNKILKIYNILHQHYGSQGWWPIINNNNLMCEYHANAPKNTNEKLEICFGAILTQSTNWHPNVVRALQQLKLGRPFTKKEKEVIKEAEVIYGKINIKHKKKLKGYILTQNTNWKNVEKAIINLNKNNLFDIKKIIKIKEKKLAQIIKSSGYHNQKSIKLKNFCEFLFKNYDGNIGLFFNNETKKIRCELLSTNGIGPETADSIILYAAKRPIFVIDAYTKKIFNRIGFKEKTYDKFQNLLMGNLEHNHELFSEYHALIVELGKNICKKEPLCSSCPLNNTCEFGLQNKNKQ